MTSPISDDYISNRAWLQAVVGGKDLILRCTSALEFHQLFGGYIHEKTIDVYAKRRGEYDNINYCIVDNFDGIEYIRFRDVLCTSVSYTVNEMLEDFDNIDEQSLLEGLNKFYCTHGMSFEGIEITPDNVDRFNAVRDWAIEYYNEG
jgi:hypothetical protein